MHTCTIAWNTVYEIHFHNIISPRYAIWGFAATVDTEITGITAPIVTFLIALAIGNNTCQDALI